MLEERLLIEVNQLKKINIRKVKQSLRVSKLAKIKDEIIIK
jgi:hypothetical protein